MNAGDMAIVAVSSPPGRSCRGLVRLSGRSLDALCEAVLDRRVEPRCLTPVRLSLQRETKPGQNRQSTEKQGLALAALALFMPGPRTFTGEDILEIQVPGNPALLDRLVRHLIEQATQADLPLRRAEAGEFTQRAFLAGRLDLTQAEGIAATINAVTDAELAAANLLRAGRLGRWAEALMNELAGALALVESGIDFVDQADVVAIAPDALDQRLIEIERRLNELLDRSGSWADLDATPWIVLAGKPNAGKSTLFNALLGRRRAVATAIAGTTRDVLCEPWVLDQAGRSIEVVLVDLAGLDRAVDQLDQQMQQAARTAMQRADLLIWLDEAGDWPKDLQGLAGSGATILRVATKADRPQAQGQPPADVAISVKNGTGMGQLKQMIAQRIRHRAASTSGQMLVLSHRHRQAAHAAADHIRSARQSLTQHPGADDLDEPELIASHLRLALDQLGRMGGQMTPDDVLGRIFSTFCVGK
jgi:tRNA modification GTPase